jgi:hypothetical protein
LTGIPVWPEHSRKVRTNITQRQGYGGAGGEARELRGWAEIYNVVFRYAGATRCAKTHEDIAIIVGRGGSFRSNAEQLTDNGRDCASNRNTHKERFIEFSVGRENNVLIFILDAQVHQSLVTFW